MKALRKICWTFLFSLTVLMFNSCSKVIGYGVVLWNVPEYNLSDGTILSVYIKSNISQVYVIALPDTGEKVEIPLWKLTEPDKKSRALKTRETYSLYQNKYAKCTLDGLPIRHDPVNTSKQVYRLRKDEVIKVLYEGDGVTPTNGTSNLDGKWLRVLTSDGSEGWCFSHNLKIFAMYADGSVVQDAEETEVVEIDETLNSMLQGKWYPDYYSSMINSGNIDLSSLDADYGFDTGSTTGIVSIKLASLNVSSTYEGVTKTGDGVYKFNETPFQVTVRGNNFIIVQYIDEKGMPKSYNFVRLGDDVDIAEVITSEIERRSQLYSSIYRLGPDFTSSNYGSLSFTEDGSFTWKKYNLLVPSVISKSAGNSGKVSIKYLLPSSLKSSWDGLLTFIFDDTGEEVNFFYKKESNGLRFSLASVSNSVNDLRTASIVSMPGNSVVIFFQN